MRQARSINTWPGGAVAGGFTLTELIVVFVVMAILASISYAGIKETLPIWELNAAARQVRADLVAAKSRATRDMREYRVVISSDGYSIERGNARAGSTAWVVDDDPRVVSQRSLDDFKGIHFVASGTDPTVVFRPTGTLDPNGGNRQVTLINSKDQIRRITISMPGRIRIE